MTLDSFLGRDGKFYKIIAPCTELFG